MAVLVFVHAPGMDLLELALRYHLVVFASFALLSLVLWAGRGQDDEDHAPLDD